MEMKHALQGGPLLVALGKMVKRAQNIWSLVKDYAIVMQEIAQVLNSEDWVVWGALFASCHITKYLNLIPDRYIWL